MLPDTWLLWSSAHCQLLLPFTAVHYKLAKKYIFFSQRHKRSSTWSWKARKHIREVNECHSHPRWVASYLHGPPEIPTICPEVTGPKPLTTRPWEQQSRWEKFIPRDFLYEDSSILISWVIYQMKSPRISHGSGCNSSLFTDGHVLRHKVTLFRVQHSSSRKYNKTCWGMAEDRWLVACSCLFSAPCLFIYLISFDCIWWGFSQGSSLFAEVSDFIQNYEFCILLISRYGYTVTAQLHNRKYIIWL